MIGKARATRDIADRAHPPLARWLGTERADELAAFVRARLEEGRPILMVYGIYNAGKSTLLNALAGEERATVSNRPETSTVTPYRWRDFEILDTPGIDAPQHHETISREQLAASDAVIFVLDSTSTFEEVRIYEELANILVARKRTIVVINNKTGLELTDREIHRVCDKVLQNLQRVCLDRGMDAGLWQNMPLRLVDVRAALKGKLEGKRLLVEHSGIEPLERDLDRVLAKADIGDVLNTVGNRLVAEIEDALESTGRTDDREARRIAEQGTALRGARTRVENSLATVVRVGGRRIEHGIVDAWRESQMAVQALVASAVDDVVAVLNAGFAEAERALAPHDLVLERPASVDLLMQAANTDEVVGEGGDPKGENSGHSGGREGVASLAREAATHRRVAAQVVENVAKQVLPRLKRWAPSLMKGIGPKTMAKWADRAGRSMSAVTVVLPTVIDFYEASKESNAATREGKRLADLASDAATRWRLDCQRASADIVDRVFSLPETALRERSSSLDEAERTRTTDHRLLLELKDEAGGLLREDELRQDDSRQSVSPR